MELMFDNYLFHPSQLGLIMTGSKTGEPFGETAKKHLMECWVNMKYGRTRHFTTRYMDKGIMAEEDSIDLYSLVKKKLFEKNTLQVSNDYFTGMPDLYEGDSVQKATAIIDLKTSWDIFTFYEVLAKGLNKIYYWQLQAYMDLTGATTSRLVYCLVNTPQKLVEDQKRQLGWKMGLIDPDIDPAYILGAAEIDKNSVFDDIKPEERYIEFIVDRDQEAIDKAHQRVIDCRAFLNGIELTEKQ